MNAKDKYLPHAEVLMDPCSRGSVIWCKACDCMYASPPWTSRKVLDEPCPKRSVNERAGDGSVG